jgi:ADP-heptose:LPS heptosyltransferase
MRLKRLELWWRGLWIRILVRLMRRSSPAGGPPDWGIRPVRVLFLRHDRAGDMILSTGVMRSIARSHPTITLDVLASPANAAIVEHAEYIENVVVFDRKRLSSYLPTALRLRRTHYDAVIDCMVTAPSLTTLLLIFASGARHRIGIGGRGNDAAFTVTVPADTRPQAHMVDLLAALAPAFDVNPTQADRQPVLHLTIDERAWADSIWAREGRRALINISAGTVERLWPDDRYVAVMRHLHLLDANVVIRVVASPAESERAERIARNGGGSFVQTPSLRQALALVATSDFVLTPDTSIAHAASAFQKPAVALFVRDKAERWGLYGTQGENVTHPEPTMTGLSAERVISAVDKVWEQAVVSRRG